MIIPDKQRQIYQIPIRVTSKHKNRFKDQNDENFYDSNCKPKGKHSKNNSPVHNSRGETMISQQIIPNQLKQQLKQRRTVYGQSFFNSPPYNQQASQAMD